MALKESSVDTLVPLLAQKSANFRSTLATVLEIHRTGKPEKDAKYLKDNVSVALTWDEELSAANDFSGLEVLRSLPEFREVMNFLKLIDKPKNGSKSDPKLPTAPKIDLSEIVELDDLKGASK